MLISKQTAITVHNENSVRQADPERTQASNVDESNSLHSYPFPIKQQDSQILSELLKSLTVQPRLGLQVGILSGWPYPVSIQTFPYRLFLIDIHAI